MVTEDRLMKKFFARARRILMHDGLWFAMSMFYVPFYLTRGNVWMLGAIPWMLPLVLISWKHRRRAEAVIRVLFAPSYFIVISRGSKVTPRSINSVAFRSLPDSRAWRKVELGAVASIIRTFAAVDDIGNGVDPDIEAMLRASATKSPEEL